MEAKDAIRKMMRERRKNMTESSVKVFSAAAQGRILADDAWKNARNVGLYIAVRHEVETGLLARSAWDSGKRVFFPFVSPGETGVMRFLHCGPDDPLRVNRFGIPEPLPENRSSSGGMEEAALDVLIVPGLAFDGKGRRIGSGGGYYDRYFARQGVNAMLRVALAYSFQVLVEIPAAAWDAPMHALATEESLVWL